VASVSDSAIQGDVKQRDLIQGTNTRRMTLLYDAFGRPQTLNWGSGRTLNVVGYYNNDDVNTVHLRFRPVCPLLPGQHRHLEHAHHAGHQWPLRPLGCAG
jgi:hypothetical protein